MIKGLIEFIDYLLDNAFLMFVYIMIMVRLYKLDKKVDSINKKINILAKREHEKNHEND